MKLTITYELPGLPKGLNGSHGHWRVAAAERKRWRKLSTEAAWIAKVSHAQEYGFLHHEEFEELFSPFKECSIICTRFSSSEPDHDNLTASFKPIIDGLKDAGVIEDDRSSCVKERKYLWEKIAPKKGKIRIEVTEL